MIRELLVNRDYDGLLEIAREFHGHICPYVALGVRASMIAMEELGVRRLDFRASVDERILAIVETNNCFADGVQIATGCTLGNNSLIYLDLGKTALTLVKRGTWEGVRVYADGEKLRRYYPPEAKELFERVVRDRNGTEEDAKRLSLLWEEIGRRMIRLPEEEFKVERVKVPPVEPAPIFESIRCSKCGELAMATRVVYINETPFCLRCAGEGYYAVLGRGIVEVKP
ncbi:FmdE family protein [Thermococcus atlanticus]